MTRIWVEKRISKYTNKVTWYLRWRDPITRKEKKKATTARTKREAEILARQLEKRIENEKYGIHEKY